MRNRLTIFTLILGVSACTQSVEGQFPGECSDEADNDLNGLFDCADVSCAQSPACADDTDNTDDTDAVVDTDVPTTTTRTADMRLPGPHAEEHGLVTAWNILTDSGVTDSSPACTDTGGEWGGLFAAPSYGGGYYYTFYRVEAPGTDARAMACGGEYPDDCSDKDYTYSISQNELSKVDLEVSDVGNGCALEVGQNVRILDQGLEGQLIFEVEIGYAGNCFGADTNNGCVVSHTFSLDFTAAR